MAGEETYDENLDEIFQNMPENRELFALLRSTGPHFQDLAQELTDAQWTAFRYLAKKGAMEGIMHLAFTDPTGTERDEYRRVSGHYIPAMPRDPIIDNSKPLTLEIKQIRLTGFGEHLASDLKLEQTHDVQKIRALVLTLLRDRKDQDGTSTVVKPPPSLNKRVVAPQQHLQRVAEQTSVSLDKYHVLRSGLFDQVLKLREHGKQWRVQYKRDVEHGDTTIPPQVTHHIAKEMTISGQPIIGISVMTQVESYAPFYEFEIVDASGAPAPPQSPLDLIRLRMEFLLRELLDTVKNIIRGLAQTELILNARQSPVDPVITRMRLKIPPFPYWLQLQGKTKEDFDKDIFEEAALIDSAKVALQQAAVWELKQPPTPAQIEHEIDAQYSKAVQLIMTAGQAMERLPATYVGKSEQDLRDHLLVTLKTHFPSVTGETFNRVGKTDIFIESVGSKVLVAECKFWAGKGMMPDLIGQILSYLTWRDNRAAIVLFVSNQNIEPVRLLVAESVKQHTSYVVDSLSERQDGWLELKMRLPHDHSRLINMAVVIFHFPEMK